MPEPISSKRGFQDMVIYRKLRNLTVLCALCLALFSGGCGVLPVSIAAVIPIFVSAGGGGIAYTVTSVAYKTFSFPFKEVEAALHSALKKMEIEEVGSEEMEWGVRITASTRKLKIYLDTEEITPATTKVKVNAKRGAFLKDKATAKEIIVQIGKILEPAVNNTPGEARDASLPEGRG